MSMRITRNYMSALMAANKSSASRRRMTTGLLSTSKNNVYNTLTNKLTGSSSQTVYQNMKTNAGELQSTVSKLKDTGDGSIYDKAAENGDTSQITSKIKDFVNQYNSTVRSLQSGTSRVDTSYLNQMNSYATMYRNTLQAVGITKNSDGTLAVNDSTLQKASVDQLRQTFGSNSSFAAKAGQVAVNVQSNAVSSMNSLINNSYSNLLRNFGTSGSFFNFFS